MMTEADLRRACREAAEMTSPHDEIAYIQTLQGAVLDLLRRVAILEAALLANRGVTCADLIAAIDAKLKEGDR